MSVSKGSKTEVTLAPPYLSSTVVHTEPLHQPLSEHRRRVPALRLRLTAKAASVPSPSGAIAQNSTPSCAA